MACCNGKRVVYRGVHGLGTDIPGAPSSFTQANPSGEPRSFQRDLVSNLIAGATLAVGIKVLAVMFLGRKR